MENQIDVQLIRPISNIELERVDLFRLRFRELWSNWESLKSLGVKLGGSFQNNGLGVINGAGCGIEHHRLKGYYLDFRFFFADKEPTHYFKITNLVCGLCDDKRLRKCLAEDREAWHRAGILREWHGYSADEITRTLFNGSFFHSADNFQEELKKLRLAMNDELVHHLLTFSIYDRMLVIRNLNWIIAPLTLESQLIRLPEGYD